MRSKKIPRNIHQIWIPPADDIELPLQNRIQSKSWADFHPDWEIKLWSLEELQQLAQEILGPNEECALRMCRFPAMQADIGRLIILYAMGGAWVDLKLIARKSFLDRTIESGVLLTEHFPTQEVPNPSIKKLLINSFIVAEPKNELILRALQIALGNVLLHNRNGGVWNLTGPRVLMRALDEYENQGRQAEFQIKVLGYQETWDKLFSIGAGNYGSQHWSTRQQDEPLYRHV